MAASGSADVPRLFDNDRLPESTETAPLQSPLRIRRKRRLKKRKFGPGRKLRCSVATADAFKENENGGSWRNLPVDIQDKILSKLSYKRLFQLKVASKWFNDHINSDGFHGCRGEMHPKEGILTALHFSTGEHGVWQCSGFDLISNSWKKLPPFQMLPRLDPALFKDHSLCAAGGIMCANVSASTSTHEKIVVFNPLTGRWKELPPLNHPRNPVLLQIIVDQSAKAYKIIAAGSARAGHEHLSKFTEVFDSRTELWTVTQDFPGPLFALNEHQTGVYLHGILYCIGFLEGEDAGKGVVAYSVDEGKWLPHLSCPLPNPTNLNIVQLVDCNGEMILFSEIENNPYIRSVEHRIDILEGVETLAESGQGRGKWRNVMSETKVGSQAGLQVYPEYACVPFGEGKLCIFNTIAHTGIVYDIQSGDRIETLPPPSWSRHGEMGFYSMNPLTFCFEPSFKGSLGTWFQSPPAIGD